MKQFLFIGMLIHCIQFINLKVIVNESFQTFRSSKLITNHRNISRQVRVITCCDKTNTKIITSNNFINLNYGYDTYKERYGLRFYPTQTKKTEQSSNTIINDVGNYIILSDINKSEVIKETSISQEALPPGYRDSFFIFLKRLLRSYLYEHHHNLFQLKYGNNSPDTRACRNALSMQGICHTKHQCDRLGGFVTNQCSDGVHFCCICE